MPMPRFLNWLLGGKVNPQGSSDYISMQEAHSPLLNEDKVYWPTEIKDLYFIPEPTSAGTSPWVPTQEYLASARLASTLTPQEPAWKRNFALSKEARAAAHAKSVASKKRKAEMTRRLAEGK